MTLAAGEYASRFDGSNEPPERACPPSAEARHDELTRRPTWPKCRGADGGQFAIGPVACGWSCIRSADGVNTWILTNHLGAKETAPQTGLVWHATPPTIGLSVALLSMAALAAFAVWEEWLNLVAGLCLVLSPWLLGFQNSDAMALHVAMAPSTSFEVWLAYAGKRESRTQTGLARICRPVLRQQGTRRSGWPVSTTQHQTLSTEAGDRAGCREAADDPAATGRGGSLALKLVGQA
jgi:hypothetical protein